MTVVGRYRASSDGIRVHRIKAIDRSELKRHERPVGELAGPGGARDRGDCVGQGARRRDRRGTRAPAVHAAGAGGRARPQPALPGRRASGRDPGRSDGDRGQPVQARKGLAQADPRRGPADAGDQRPLRPLRARLLLAPRSGSWSRSTATTSIAARCLRATTARRNSPSATPAWRCCASPATTCSSSRGWWWPRSPARSPACGRRLTVERQGVVVAEGNGGVFAEGQRRVFAEGNVASSPSGSVSSSLPANGIFSCSSARFGADLRIVMSTSERLARPNGIVGGSSGTTRSNSSAAVARPARPGGGGLSRHGIARARRVGRPGAGRAGAGPVGIGRTGSTSGAVGGGRLGSGREDRRGRGARARGRPILAGQRRLGPVRGPDPRPAVGEERRQPPAR